MFTVETNISHASAWLVRELFNLDFPDAQHSMGLELCLECIHYVIERTVEIYYTFNFGRVPTVNVGKR